ncbi:hypothetical protein DMUE_6293, partial [Dictyocoela muelleri]
SLYDEHPFEHQFFLRISQSFLLMQKLSLTNRHAQNHKQSTSQNENLSIVKYSCLTELDIERVHEDYVEQFLCNMKICLQNPISLRVEMKSLEKVTHRFTRDDTRINCAKINRIFLHRRVESDPQSLQNYFPFAKIFYTKI